MSAIDKKRFTCRIPIRAGIKELYTAWTTTSEIEKWFLRKAVYKCMDKKTVGRSASITEGCNYTWEWYGYDGIEKGKIMVANGKDHLQFTFARSVVDVTLEKRGKEVIVELTQSGIPADASSQKDIRLGCHVGWTFWLANLKSVYEGGLNLRNTNEELTGMINN